MPFVLIFPEVHNFFYKVCCCGRKNNVLEEFSKKPLLSVTRHKEEELSIN